MTLSDLEWPFHGSSVPSYKMMILLKELNANINAVCTSSTLKSTLSASRAISAVAELLVNIAQSVQLSTVRKIPEKGRTFSKGSDILYCNSRYCQQSHVLALAHTIGV